jgi:uncharacterized protein
MSPPPHELDSDLEALDQFLMSDQAPDDCMMLSDLDGFLTGLAVGPELIAPSEWLPLVWGGDEEPVFDSAAEAQSVLGAIMRRYNEILGQIADGYIEPIFIETIAGEVIAADWAEGFMQAIALRAAAWEKLLTSEDHGHALIPILALCGDDEGEPLLDLPQEVAGQLFAEADELIPACALEIAEFWRAARSTPRARSTAPKTGRNDPCPCGSGKKFKKCCGLVR